MFYLIVLILISNNSIGQFLSYNFPSEIDSALQKDTVSWKYQNAATDLSFIGEYVEALKTWDLFYKPFRKVRTNQQLDSLLKEPKELLATYKPIAAKDYILNEAKKTRFVIINEAHHNPRHRAFVETLLPELYALGYKEFGIETLGNDPDLSQRKYPIIFTGTYSREPSFGNLIREAIHLGFNIFPYDTTVTNNGKDREITAASLIYNVFTQHPDDKFIIYCGYDYAIEDSTGTSWGLAVAGRLKRMTGVDPLTLDQVQLTETSDLTYDNKFRQAIKLNYSAVLINSSGKAFNKALPDKAFDANIYHPNTRIVNGRPDWLQTKNRNAVNISNKINISCPCILKAYKEGEEIGKAVPVDIIFINDKAIDKKLILYKGVSYLIQVENEKGEKQLINYNN